MQRFGYALHSCRWLEFRPLNNQFGGESEYCEELMRGTSARSRANDRSRTARYLASNNNLPMLYLSVLLLLTVLGITPAASGPHLVSAATATVVQPGAVRIGVDVQGNWFVNDRPSPYSEFPGFPGILQEAL